MLIMTKKRIMTPRRYKLLAALRAVMIANLFGMPAGMVVLNLTGLPVFSMVAACTVSVLASSLERLFPLERPGEEFGVRR